MANRIQISTRWFGLATAILLCFSFNAWAMEGDPDEGQKEYLEHCSQCHGEDGNADGSGALFMLPRPRVFKENTSYKIRTTPSGELPTEQDLFNIISKGFQAPRCLASMFFLSKSDGTLLPTSAPSPKTLKTRN